MPKTIGIIGTRKRDDYEDFDAVWKAFIKIYEPGDKICSGKCLEGGDRFAEIITDILRLPDSHGIWYPPDWEKYGKRAGFIRNADIAESSDVLIACVAKNRIGGTEDTIRKYRKLGKKDYVIV